MTAKGNVFFSLSFILLICFFSCLLFLLPSLVSSFRNFCFSVNSSKLLFFFVCLVLYLFVLNFCIPRLSFLHWLSLFVSVLICIYFSLSPSFLNPLLFFYSSSFPVCFSSWLIKISWKVFLYLYINHFPNSIFTHNGRQVTYYRSKLDIRHTISCIMYPE